MLKSLRDTFVRIDPRSLGLFRIAMGVVLLVDWVQRKRWIKEFYSNEGVLPNHNHLFLLLGSGHEHTRVWSALHAFSSPGESAFAFYVILFVYLMFVVGYRTRVFHALALVCLVSLSARNILLENSGNYIAIALLAFTLFLPLGSRFSADALRRSMEDVDEKDADALNGRAEPTEAAIAAARSPGWSPVSIAALATLLQIAFVYAVSAYQRTGAWLDGTALHYALNGDLFVTQIGVHARSFPPAILVGWTRLLRAAELGIPVFIFLPVATRYARFVAVALSIVYGVSFGLLFDVGLYGWALAAAALLLVPAAAWDARLRPDPKRAVTLIYDADCGVCLWICRVLKRLDLRGHLAFQGNDALDALQVHGYRQRASTELPAEITDTLVLDTVVAVDAERRVMTRGRAAAAAIGALPLGFLVAWPMRIPGISQLVDVLYDFVAARRQRISVLMGKDACGIPLEPGAAPDAAEEIDPEEVPAATRALRVLTGGSREIAALLMLLAMFVQTSQANLVPHVAQSQMLAAIAQWPRMMARWNVFVPEPLHDDSLMVIDAQTRDGRSVDTLTGLPPDFDLATARGLDLGQLWGDYLVAIHEKENIEFQRAFRDYLGKGGPRWDSPIGDSGLSGFDAYWVTEAIPPPGQARDPQKEKRDKLFSYSRGGKMGDRPFPPQNAP